MMPKSVRGLLKVRRTCRKKIHERITAVSGKCFSVDDCHRLFIRCGGLCLCHVSAMLAALQRAETEKGCRSDLSKAAEKLGKILNEVDIRSFMDSMLQKNSTEM